MQIIAPNITKNKNTQGLSTTLRDMKRPDFFSPIVQPKLSINQPNDMYEQEADAMADRVMRMEDPSTTHQPFFKPSVLSIQRKCSMCDQEEKLQRKENSSSMATSSMNHTGSYIQSLAGGAPLSKAQQGFFSPRMGYDFSKVRLHTDTTANQSAKNINALAYTHGNNIVFGSHQFSPETQSGKRLLAHELTHVIQQNSGSVGYVQRMAACPPMLNDGAPTPAGWKNYFGPTGVFHCGFRTILEDRSPSPNDPMNECVYDHSGRLVDENHPYSGCRGTPDQYDSKSAPIRHATIDSGGIVRAGVPALASSALHAIASPFEDAYNWLDRGVRGIYGR